MSKRKTQQRTLETRAAIKATGAELFATRGYRATGVRDIADLAGCNQALVSYHFGSKGGLYDEILADAVAEAQLLARQADLVSAEYPERELVRIMAQAIAARDHFAPMILREQLDPERLLNVETGNILRSMMSLTESVLDALPLDVEARGWDPQIVHLCVVGPLIHFVVATRMREATAAKIAKPMTTPSLDEFVEVQAAILSRALRKD
ncbi:MAG: TetR/AcrR family transcriptional regulator [Alphaproteobacteria bacterium]|nr:MAG: TetR/AcrR family transcriptional regulator [Alphaproteobacteria bacterium]